MPILLTYNYLYVHTMCVCFAGILGALLFMFLYVECFLDALDLVPYVYFKLVQIGISPHIDLIVFFCFCFINYKQHFHNVLFYRPKQIQIAGFVKTVLFSIYFIYYVYYCQRVRYSYWLATCKNFSRTYLYYLLEYSTP